MALEPEVGFGILAPKEPRVEFAQVLIGIERSVRLRTLDAHCVAQHGGEHVDRAAIICGADVGGSSGTAVEVDVADSRRRNVGPRVVGRVIGVLEGNPVPGHGVVAVGESAVVGFCLPVSNAIDAPRYGSWSGLGNVAEVSHWRSEVADVAAGDFGACRCCIEQRFDRGILHSDGRVCLRLDGHFLRDRCDR